MLFFVMQGIMKLTFKEMDHNDFLSKTYRIVIRLILLIYNNIFNLNLQRKSKTCVVGMTGSIKDLD